MHIARPCGCFAVLKIIIQMIIVKLVDKSTCNVQVDATQAV